MLILFFHKNKGINRFLTKFDLMLLTNIFFYKNTYVHKYLRFATENEIFRYRVKKSSLFKFRRKCKQRSSSSVWLRQEWRDTFNMLLTWSLRYGTQFSEHIAMGSKIYLANDLKINGPSLVLFFMEGFVFYLLEFVI